MSRTASATKRYALFGGKSTDGGWNDFRDSFSSKEMAKAYLSGLMAGEVISWYQLVDLHTGEIVATDDDKTDADNVVNL